MMGRQEALVPPVTSGATSTDTIRTALFRCTVNCKRPPRGPSAIMNADLSPSQRAAPPRLAPSDRARQAAESDLQPGSRGAGAYGERALVFVLYRRRPPRNVVFCRLSDADTAATHFFDTGRALGIFPGGRIRHRRIRLLALGLHGGPAAQGPSPARRQACRRDRLRDRCGLRPVAGGAMAEFDPRADGTRAGRHRPST